MVQEEKALRRFLSKALAALCSVERNYLWNCGRRHHEEQLCEIIFEFGPVVHEMFFKDISYLELWQPFCSAERNHLCNFDRGYYKERFYEIILNLDQWFRRRCLLKIYYIWSSGNPFVWWNHVEGIKRKNSVS